MNFQVFKLDLEKAEEPEMKLPTSVGSSKQESSRKTSTSTLLSTPKPLTVSVQFSHSVVSDSLRPHEPQASLSITNSRSPPKPMSIESVMPSSHLILCLPLLFLPPVPPSIRVFSNELFRWGGQSTGVSGSASVLKMNTQDWSLSGWTGWISLQSKGLSRVFSNTTLQSINFSVLSFLYSPTLTSLHDHWKNHSLD